MSTLRPQNRPEPAEEAAQLGPWFHNLHLPDGTQTAPDHFLGDFPRYKWEVLAPHLPADLRGWTALDIGCNGGFYSIALAQRGARVMAIDHDPCYLEQIRWAVDVFGLRDRVTVRRQQVYDLARDATSYDLVLFMGVFYHLRYPLLALDAVAQRVGRQLVFQSLSLPGEHVFEPADDYPFEARAVLRQRGWPALAFVEKRFAHDPTNWFIPSRSAIEALLRAAGLAIQKRIEPELYLCAPDGSDFASRCPGNPEEYAAATGVRHEGANP